MVVFSVFFDILYFNRLVFIRYANVFYEIVPKYITYGGLYLMIEYRKVTLGESALLAKICIDFLCEANDVSREDEKNRLFDSN